MHSLTCLTWNICLNYVIFVHKEVITQSMGNYSMQMQKQNLKSILDVSAILNHYSVSSVNDSNGWEWMLLNSNYSLRSSSFFKIVS